MTSNNALVAFFTLMPDPMNYTIAISYSGTGYGMTDPLADNYTYPRGESVTVTATPSSGSTFDGWIMSGVRYDHNPINISMNSNCTLVAYFTLNTIYYTLTISHTGTGSGTTNPVAGSSLYVAGSTINVTATASTGSKFSGWTLDGNPASQNPLSITISSDAALVATFTAVQPPPTYYALTISYAGTGSGTTSPAAGTYSRESGGSVTVTATAASGSAFDGWTLNGMAYAQNPMTYTISSDAALVATFTAVPTDVPLPPTKVIYFECTFSGAGPNPYALGDYWPEREPVGYRCEKGVWHWMDVRYLPDGSVYNTNNGQMRLINDPADASRLCLEMILDAKGTRPLGGNQHCKLYNIQSRDARNWGEPYPTLKEAYYHMEVWIPQEFQVAPGSWRLIWQICGDEGVYGTSGFYGPELQLTFGDSALYLINNEEWRSTGERATISVMSTSSFPKGRWVSIDVYAKQGTGFSTLDGTVTVWIDGSKVLERHDLATATKTGTPYFVWGIGNYGGQYEPCGQYIYFRNIKVTSAPI